MLQVAYPYTGLFLIEMIRVRAGMKEALHESRVRENRTLEAIEIPANFVFRGLFGPDRDVMTMALEKTSPITAPQAQTWPSSSARTQPGPTASRAWKTWPTLRELLTEHSDTLASALQ